MLSSARSRALVFLASASLAALAGCGGDGDLASEESARRAYLGLDQMIDRSFSLGMAGYNAASSANIPDQQASGGVAGTITVGGKVDQGASSNKEMTLVVTLVGYQDSAKDGDEPVAIIYDTPGAAPAKLGLSLKNLPDGTFTGSLVGDFDMRGDLEGEVRLDLSLEGETEAVAGGDGNDIQRKPGTTKIRGTASSEFGVYDVNLTR